MLKYFCRVTSNENKSHFSGPRLCTSRSRMTGENLGKSCGISRQTARKASLRFPRGRQDHWTTLSAKRDTPRSHRVPKDQSSTGFCRQMWGFLGFFAIDDIQILKIRSLKISIIFFRSIFTVRSFHPMLGRSRSYWRQPIWGFGLQSSTLWWTKTWIPVWTSR